MDNQILAHTKYNCTYHIVFIPKYRRKVMYGKIGKEVGEILSTVCKITGVKLIKGGVCPNHVHLYVSIPPKMSISEVMSKLKGKSALMIFDRHPQYRDKFPLPPNSAAPPFPYPAPASCSFIMLPLTKYKSPPWSSGILSMPLRGFSNNRHRPSPDTKIL